MTVIRPLTEPDLPDVLRMVHALALYHGDPVAVTLAQLRRDTLGAHPWVRVLVAEGKGYAALCPLTQLQYGARGMDMHHLFVEEPARARGVGRALITASITLARELGCRYMTVGTHPDNLTAQGVYRALGFEEMGGAGPRFRVKW